MPQRAVFITHSAAGSGAELLLARLLSKPLERPAQVVVFEDGPLVARLRAQGVDTVVLPAGAGVLAFRRQSGVLSAAGLIGPTLAASRALARLTRRDDIIVCTSQKAFLFACLARLQRRFPLVWWLHDILTPDHFSPGAIRITTQLSRRLCRQVIANSPESEAAYLAAGGSAAMTRVVEPGVELAVFDEAVRMHPAGARERPLLVHVSRLAPWKNQMALVEAMARVEGVDCWIVGASLFGEEDYARALAERIETLGLGGRVTLTGARSDVPQILASASMFAHVPLAAEPFGQVVVEAMAAGLPVIVSNEGAPGRIVNDAFGVRIDPTDVDALTGAIAELAADPQRQIRMGRAARRAAAPYDIDAMRTKFCAALGELDAESGAPARGAEWQELEDQPNR